MKKLIEMLKEKIRNRLEMTRDRWRYSGWKYRTELVAKVAGIASVFLLAAGLAIAYAVGLSSSGDENVRVELDRSASLKGIDVDINGIRDDLDTYINARASKGGWTPIQTKSVQQAARATQDMINFESKPGGKKVAAHNVAKLLSASIDCEFVRFGRDAAKIDAEMTRVMLNTKERILAADRFDEEMSGSVTRSNLSEVRCVP